MNADDYFSKRLQRIDVLDCIDDLVCLLRAYQCVPVEHRDAIVIAADQLYSFIISSLVEVKHVSV